MVSDYTIARYLNNLGNESRLGDWNTDLNDADSGADALNPGNAAFDASEARARYLGLGGTSSREMFATFSNQLNVLLGRPAQNYGQNSLFGKPGMQYPGMQNALAAPVHGVNVYVGAPVFGQAIVTGGGEITGAGSAPAGGGVNVTANIGGGEATGAEKLDEAVKAAQEKAPEGYEPSEWKRIVDDAKAAAEKRAKANDTDADDEFRDILNKLPTKDLKEEVDENGDVVGLTEEQKKAEYGRKLGEWYAEEIEGIDGTPERARLVDDVAGQDKEGFKLERASGKKLPGNVKAYTVSGDASRHGLSEGQKIFWVEDPKSGQGGWFKEASRKGLSGKIDGLGVKGGDTEIEVGGRSDWIELGQEEGDDRTVAGAVDEKTKHAPLYDSFKIKAAKGETSDAINADNDNVYRDSDGKWYVKQGDKFVEMEKQPKLVAGRLYFNDAKVPVDPSRVDDLPAYMDSLRDGAKEMKARQKASETIVGTNASWPRVMMVDKAMDEQIMKYEKAAELRMGSDTLDIEYDPTKGVINITCAPEDCQQVVAAMGFGQPGDAEKKRQVNAILQDLPKGVDVYYNGTKLNLSEDKPIKELVLALEGQGYRPVTVKTGKPIDLSIDRLDDKMIVDALAEKVEAAKKQSKTGNVSEIVFEDEVIFPESFSTTEGGGGDKVLDAAHVRNIAYKLSEKFGHVPVSFGKATRKGDPEGLSFVTGVTKSDVEQRNADFTPPAKLAAPDPKDQKPKAKKLAAPAAAPAGIPMDKPVIPESGAEQGMFAWQRELTAARQKVASAPAAAAPTAETPKDDAGSKARALYTEGKALYEAGKYVEAEAKFQECYDVKPHYTTLRSIAECKYEQGDKAEALVYLNKAKQYPKQDADFEKRLDERIAEVEGEIPQSQPATTAAAPKPAAPAPAPVPAPAAPAPASAPAAASGWAALGDDGTGNLSAPAPQAKAETQGEKILREAQELAAQGSSGGRTL